jgi:hypothetical protein
MEERAESLRRATAPTAPLASDSARERMQAGFCEAFLSAVPFKEEAALVERLSREAGPALDALRTAYEGDPAESTSGASLHESYALLTLLARQAAALQVTPTGALVLAQSMVAGLAAIGTQLSERASRALSTIVVEGYCAAREEQVGAALRRAAAESQPLLPIAERCFAICLGGQQRAEELAPVLAGYARDLLRSDARSCLLDLERLVLDEEILRAVGHFCAELETLGVALFVSGASERVRARFAEWSVAAREFQPRFEDALPLALAAVDCELRPLPVWSRLLRRRAPPR